MASAPIAIPLMTGGRAPVRCSTRVCTVVAVITIMPVIGRNPSPVRSGEKPRLCCM
jgi:hypothetical protein